MQSTYKQYIDLKTKFKEKQKLVHTDEFSLDLLLELMDIDLEICELEQIMLN